MMEPLSRGGSRCSRRQRCAIRPSIGYRNRLRSMKSVVIAAVQRRRLAIRHRGDDMRGAQYGVVPSELVRKIARPFAETNAW